MPYAGSNACNALSYYKSFSLGDCTMEISWYCDNSTGVVSLDIQIDGEDISCASQGTLKCDADSFSFSCPASLDLSELDGACQTDDSSGTLHVSGSF